MESEIGPGLQFPFELVEDTAEPFSFKGVLSNSLKFFLVSNQGVFKVESKFRHEQYKALGTGCNNSSNIVLTDLDYESEFEQQEVVKTVFGASRLLAGRQRCPLTPRCHD
ncbi:hypothetical protein Tco_0750561 [Tanacetum coccineum]|uniref:Uncharacterized protein n=1 Tax=Tanacetum coccineum TaxID=301880 RepID=A0ABQ4Z2J3_9ASTR